MLFQIITLIFLFGFVKPNHHHCDIIGLRRSPGMMSDLLQYSFNDLIRRFFNKGVAYLK